MDLDDCNAPTARVLALEGCDVVIPPGQGCLLDCGRSREGRHVTGRHVPLGRRLLTMWKPRA